MRNLIVIAALIASPAAAQFTTCNSYGNQTNCNTVQTPQPGQPVQPAPNPLLNGLLQPGGNTGGSFNQGQRNYEARQATIAHDRCVAMADRASNAGDYRSAAAILKTC